ncbi:FAD-linked oxidoreductase aurO [Colletotrichum siamense]|uniref:FAD-linked oxidoreductase aurO n=1 Tax=Colletotrichum siamense TaxID=690259 RepID=UPI0018729684|nr:FAD-linked oxidoreductase aurO [Colletotrichum siamense]KAF5500631.1 FAD-linked oxidoreductase aurO [Colletotrichum siamense]
MAAQNIITDDMVALLQKEQIESGVMPVDLFFAGSDEYAEHRKLRDGAKGFEHIRPAGIAVPRDGSEVGRLVRWAKSVDLKFTIRGGGNDFWARSIAHDTLMIDMRGINSIKVVEDRQTVVIGGGVLMKDLILALDDVGLMTPTGHTWIIGYAGWVSNGGYGTSTHIHGMGIEQVVGAELVYPKHDPLGGFLIFESSDIRKTLEAYFEATTKLPMPKELTIHNFISWQAQGGVVFSVIWTWTGDIEEGQACLQSWKDNAPPLLASTVEVLPDKVRQQNMPPPCPLKGGQRNCFLTRLPTSDAGDELAAAILDAAEAMPKTMGPNIAWGGLVDIDAATMPPNCFVDKSHSYFSCSYQHPTEEYAEDVIAWSKSLIARPRSLGGDTVLDSGYPATNPPGERSAAELYGEKWNRVKELKMKYDPTNVFSHAYPKIDI